VTEDGLKGSAEHLTENTMHSYTYWAYTRGGWNTDTRRVSEWYDVIGFVR